MNISLDNSGKPQKQIKNIRSMIKANNHTNSKTQFVEFVPMNQGTFNYEGTKELILPGEPEISFNITPDEDEIKCNLVTDNYNHFEEDYEMENNKIQKEAKELIMKTRKMMETIDAHRYSSIGGGDEILTNFESYRGGDLKELSQPQYNSAGKAEHTDFQEEKPYDPSMIKKSEKKSEINSRTNNNNSILNQRLLEKIKIIKTLEKDLKDKNSLIDRLNLKIDKQGMEINKLNERLNVFTFLK
jgi:hypothetical protein